MLAACLCIDTHTCTLVSRTKSNPLLKTSAFGRCFDVGGWVCTGIKNCLCGVHDFCQCLISVWTTVLCAHRLIIEGHLLFQRTCMCTNYTSTYVSPCHMHVVEYIMVHVSRLCSVIHCNGMCNACMQTKELPRVSGVEGAAVLLNLGDSVTTDHISPAGSISRTSPAARYLASCG